MSPSVHVRLPHPLIWVGGLHSTSSCSWDSVPRSDFPRLVGLLPVSHTLPESMASGEDPVESSAVPGVVVGNTPRQRDPSALSSGSSGSWLVFLKARLFSQVTNVQTLHEAT